MPSLSISDQFRVEPRNMNGDRHSRPFETTIQARYATGRFLSSDRVHTLVVRVWTAHLHLRSATMAAYSFPGTKNEISTHYSASRWGKRARVEAQGQ
jgi:hypothetical protein